MSLRNDNEDEHIHLLNESCSLACQSTASIRLTAGQSQSVSKFVKGQKIGWAVERSFRQRFDYSHCASSTSLKPSLTLFQMVRINPWLKVTMNDAKANDAHDNRWMDR
jgi:hypothetical protein